MRMYIYTHVHIYTLSSCGRAGIGVYKKFFDFFEKKRRQQYNKLIINVLQAVFRFKKTPQKKQKKSTFALFWPVLSPMNDLFRGTSSGPSTLRGCCQ